MDSYVLLRPDFSRYSLSDTVLSVLLSVEENTLSVEENTLSVEENTELLADMLELLEQLRE